MEKQIIDLRRMLLEKDFFDETNAQVVMEWLVAVENRRPVVVVGAGFSLNAKHKYRGDYAGRREVPLWGPITKRMADDLGIDQHSYDGPTMAEMYECAFGEAKMRDMLRGMLDDENLEPGEAHQALSGYALEAIITTNLLDTLLEKIYAPDGNVWNRVIEDSDLSVSGRDGQKFRDLIYFHGHRASPATWVYTRSQYEDIAKKKPAILTRTRQLMAQHPLLIVGYSLSDPDFHQIYRQLSHEMRTHQPLGLAIMIGRVTEAERNHWRRLGIRLAAPDPKKNWEGSVFPTPEQGNTFFKQLFPHLETSWSPNNEAMLRYVREGRGLKERFERFEKLLPHQKREEHQGYFDQRNDDFKSWRETLFSLLGDDEKKQAGELAHKVLQAILSKDEAASPSAHQISITIGAPGRIPVQERERDIHAFRHLPNDREWRRLRDSRLYWEIDKILDRYRSDWQSIAGHFYFALENNLFHSDTAEEGVIPWIPLTFWLSANSDFRKGGDLKSLCDRCLRAERKYRPAGYWENWIKEEAKKHNIELVSEPDSTEPDHLTKARNAFQAMLDRDFSGAQKLYGAAAEKAKSEGWIFEEWAWREGEVAALNVLEQRQTQSHKRLKALRTHQVVTDWERRSNERMVEVLQEGFDQQRKQERNRAYGMSSGFSSWAPRMAMRLFRDLETIDAPPFLQAQYVKPLLSCDILSARTELQRRILLPVKDSGDWLRLYLDAPAEDVMAQRKRDEDLVNVFFEKKSEHNCLGVLSRRVEIFPALEKALREADVEDVYAFLSKARQRLTDKDGSDFPTHSLPRMLASVASVYPLYRLREWLEAWPPNSRQALSIRSWARLFSNIDWGRTALFSPGELIQWLKLLTGMLIDILDDKPLSHEHALFAFGLMGILSGIDKYAPSLLAQIDRKPLLDFAQWILERPLTESYNWEARRWGYWIERILNQISSEGEEQLLNRWATEAGFTDSKACERLELRCSLIFDALMEKESNTQPSEPHYRWLRTLWDEMEAGQLWEKTYRKRYVSNSHLSFPIIAFYVCCMRFLEDTRETAAARLLDLLTAAPIQLSLLAPIFHPSFWGRAWPELLDLIFESAGGIGGARPSGDSFMDISGKPTEHQMGAMSLLANHAKMVERSELVADTQIQAALEPLKTAATLLLSDERMSVAFEAAKAIVPLAELAADEHELQRHTRALRRMARDTRVSVRAVAAYGAARLVHLAKHEQMRRTASEISQQLADDPNALLKSSEQLGRLEAEYNQRSTKATTPPESQSDNPS